VQQNSNLYSITLGAASGDIGIAGWIAPVA
jgi:hypothetical protein